MLYKDKVLFMTQVYWIRELNLILSQMKVLGEKNINVFVFFNLMNTFMQNTVIIVQGAVH